MQLTKTKEIITQHKQLPGLFSCTLERTIKSSKGSLDWTGPKISRDVWNQVLSFFKWTYDTAKSESQVRLYVSAERGEWIVWAPPQEAGTGMTAKELSDLPAWKEQRALIGGEWEYFGTVHHHCSAGAFQSGTDESNEKNQDGLHITIGKMDSNPHDFHARIYLGGEMFAVDMYKFFDVEPLLAQVPDFARSLLTADALDQLARAQMCIPSNVEFPQIWKENYIERPSAMVPFNNGMGGGNWTPGFHNGSVNGSNGGGSSRGSGKALPLFTRRENALSEILELARRDQMELGEVESYINEMANEVVMADIVKMCLKHEVDLEDLAQEFEWQKNALMTESSCMTDEQREAWDAYVNGELS